MPLHRLVNPGPDALVCADGTFWEVGEQRTQDPAEHFTERALYTGRLTDLGDAADAEDTPRRGARRTQPEGAQ
jgi:hypothetical protein